VRCPSCARENEPFYRFCLGCGQPLEPGATGDPRQRLPTEPKSPAPLSRSVDASGNSPEAPAGGESLLAAEPPQPERVCARCGRALQPGFTFCGTCGARYAPPAAVAPLAKPPLPSPSVGGPESGASGGPLPLLAAGSPLPPVAQAPASPASPALHARLAPEAPPAPRAWLVQIQADGSEGGKLPVPAAGVTVGRTGDSALFEADPFLSPLHATFWVDARGTILVRDEGSLNGTFLRVREPTLLQHGSVFRIGQELLRLELLPQEPLAPDAEGTVLLGSPSEGVWGRICLLLGPERIGDAHLLSGRSVRLGRERGEIIFPEDGFVSGLHAELTHDGARVTLRDLGSSNGTYVRLRREIPLTDGDFLLLGQQLFLLRLV